MLDTASRSRSTSEFPAGNPATPLLGSWAGSFASLPCDSYADCSFRRYAPRVVRIVLTTAIEVNRDMTNGTVKSLSGLHCCLQSVACIDRGPTPPCAHAAEPLSLRPAATVAARAAIAKLDARSSKLLEMARELKTPAPVARTATSSNASEARSSSGSSREIRRMRPPMLWPTSPMPKCARCWPTWPTRWVSTGAAYSRISAVDPRPRRARPTATGPAGRLPHPTA
jgi:hypothetical protein